MTRVIAIVGATAVGKSDLAVALAERIGGEVINADSMQLYRGMDIGTAKLTVHERRGVPHHLLDIWEVTEPASVAEYQRSARSVLDELLGRDLTPIVVGGSGLYIRALLDDMDFPGTDADVRARLESELDAVGPARMHLRLKERDPDAAEAILPSNGRRIVRALEVIEITGAPFTASLPDPVPVYDSVRIGLEVSREVLDQRIDRRVEQMWDAGLVEEVKELEGRGIRHGLTASRALGYAQILDALSGNCSLEQARMETARATRRFARRQDSWFRRDPHVHWISSTDDPLAQVLTCL